MTNEPSIKPTGIIGAMREEIELLTADLTHGRTQRVMGFDFHTGVLDDQPVIMMQCGIGKVNAAMGTVALLSQGVSRVIFTGVAGALHPDLQPGDMVVSTDCVQHDVDVTPLGYEPGLIPDELLAWPADPTLRSLAFEAARTVSGVRTMEGRIASGDQFIASPERGAWIRQTFSAACAEMEGAAVAQVCARWGVPFVVIRSMSDTADHDANVDYRQLMPVVARHAKQVVRAMLTRLNA